MQYLDYLEIYSWGIVITISILSITAGYMEKRLTKNDVIDSIFWPVTLMNFVGNLLKLVFSKE